MAPRPFVRSAMTPLQAQSLGGVPIRTTSVSAHRGLQDFYFSIRTGHLSDPDLGINSCDALGFVQDSAAPDFRDTIVNFVVVAATSRNTACTTFKNWMAKQGHQALVMFAWAAQSPGYQPIRIA